jgi:hypothetical protein
MTTSHMKTGVESTPETSCIRNMPQSTDNVQQNVLIIADTGFKSYCSEERKTFFCGLKQCSATGVPRIFIRNCTGGHKVWKHR